MYIMIYEKYYMKIQFFYIIFYEFALKATEIGNRKESVKRYDNSQRHSKDVDMTEDIYEKVFDLMNQIIIKLENTFIIKDGQDKLFEPSRKHTHEYEHKLFFKWLGFFKRTVKNLDKNPKTILESIYIYKKEYEYFTGVRCKTVAPYLSKWVANANAHLNELECDFNYMRDDYLVINRTRSFFTFCNKFNATLDGYINDAFEIDMNFFISFYESKSSRIFANNNSDDSDIEKIFKLINKHLDKKPELKNEIKVEIHKFNIRKGGVLLRNDKRFRRKDDGSSSSLENEVSDSDERHR